MSILIVDDDVSLLGMFSLRLEQEGYDVLTAASRLQAMQQFEEHNIEVILLDLGMPPNEHSPEEGLALLDWLREHHQTCHTIVLTGQEPGPSAYQAIQHGAFDFLEKPVMPEELVTSLARAKLYFDNLTRMATEDHRHQIELSVEEGQGVKAVRNQAEEKLIRQVLNDSGFNVHETARRLALKRENVYYLMKKYDIKRPDQDA